MSSRVPVGLVNRIRTTLEQHVSSVSPTFGDVGADSISTEDTVTGTLGYDYSDSYPQAPRQPEQSGPLTLAPHPLADNPVLTGSDITDITNPGFVADPFLVYDSGTYHLFFEARDNDTGNGSIAHATSPDGLTWTYDQVILSEAGVHMSYPHVFKHEGVWYLTPQRGVDEFKIYKFDTFPTSVSVVETAITATSGENFDDPTLVLWNGTWYLFSFDGTTDVLLHYSDSLIGGTWTEHPSSPVLSTSHAIRNAGRPIVHEDYIDIFYQDGDNTGGNTGDRVSYYRITELTKSAITQTETAVSPIVKLTNTGGWNDDRMHHVDVLLATPGGKDIAVVDGHGPNSWSLGIYTLASQPPLLAVLTKSSAQAHNSGTTGRVTFDGVSVDLNDGFSDANDWYTIPISGYYHLTGRVEFSAPSAAGDFYAFAQLWKNGTTLNEDYAHSHSAQPTTLRVDYTGWLETGDDIRIQNVEQTSGEQLTITTNTYLSVVRFG